MIQSGLFENMYHSRLHVHFRAGEIVKNRELIITPNKTNTECNICNRYELNVYYMKLWKVLTLIRNSVHL